MTCLSKVTESASPRHADAPPARVAVASPLATVSCLPPPWEQRERGGVGGGACRRLGNRERERERGGGGGGGGEVLRPRLAHAQRPDAGGQGVRSGGEDGGTGTMWKGVDRTGRIPGRQILD